MTIKVVEIKLTNGSLVYKVAIYNEKVLVEIDCTNQEQAENVRKALLFTCDIDARIL